jgi:hypothetical protein
MNHLNSGRIVAALTLDLHQRTAMRKIGMVRREENNESRGFWKDFRCPGA